MSDEPTDFTSPIAELPEAPPVRPVEGVAVDERALENRRRRSRSERAKRRRQQRNSAALAVALVVASVALAAVVVSKLGPRTAGGADAPEPARAAETVSVTSRTTASAAFSDSFDPTVEPTPVFASYRSLRLNLPVPADSLTAIAFHQASSDKAMPMESLLPNADMKKAIALKKTASYVFTTDTSGTPVPDGVPSILKGEVLRLWRSHRVGSTDRCADVGAKPGTPVYSPVTGTVLLVRAYDLYRKYPDYEVHIRPDGWDEVDCVLIHVDKVRVEPGDRVLGGVTRIAEIRLLSDRVPHQLGEYVSDGGDHTHVQLNRLAVPGKIEIENRVYDVSRPGQTVTVSPK